MNSKHIFAGIAAITIGAALTGCSHDFDYVSPAQAVTDTYNRIFVENFGQPSADQDWGFGDTKALTRAVPETSSHINANANEWADPNKEFGGWLVPDPLTEGQKLRVQLYFQSHPNLTYEDPHWENFFVQQVYKGNTDPGENSTEVVVAANGSDYDSDDMNLLTVGQAEHHINNFNNGNCSVNNNVLDNGGNVNDGPYHSDQIMLMVNIDDTSCFGYHMTGNSLQRNDRCALVDAAVIDAWAEANGIDGDPVVDKWNRSFLGFDLDLFTLEDSYARRYDWATTPATFLGYEEFKFQGQTYYYLNSNMNMYSGDFIEITDAEKTDAKIAKLLADGYLPVSGGADKKWCKWSSGADGYYSDWIVTLCKAKRISDDDDNTTTEETWGEWKRIIAEDLSVTQRTDFDFNDVVFDARINSTGTKAEIVLKAAGGTLPLTVGWSGKPGTSHSEFEVHNMYKVATNVMVNTKAKNGRDGLADVRKTLVGDFSGGYNSIKIMVQKRGEWIEIEAHKGEPAGKIVVETTYEWCDEREDISERYPLFLDYVKDPSQSSAWYE